MVRLPPPVRRTDRTETDPALRAAPILADAAIVGLMLCGLWTVWP